MHINEKNQGYLPLAFRGFVATSLNYKIFAFGAYEGAQFVRHSVIMHHYFIIKVFAISPAIQFELIVFM